MSIVVKFENLHLEIKSELEKANQSITIAVAWITFNLYDELFRSLIDKGVKIKILCTNSYPNIKQSTDISSLQKYGVDIRLCEMPLQRNHMHHKFAIIDNSIILNGSFNWSKNAEKSFENLTIIKNEPDLVSSFINEYEKIEQLDKKAIKSLQTKNRCDEKGCDGKCSNLLVFQSLPMRKSYEVWGDVVKCCSVCGEESFITLVRGVQDAQLHTFLSGSEQNLDDEEFLLFNRQVDSYLTGYSQKNVVIHAIGFVCSELLGKYEEFIFTKVVWKNKFVSDDVRDRYDTNFDVSYE